MQLYADTFNTIERMLYLMPKGHHLSVLTGHATGGCISCGQVYV